jgi:hypothetical protein
MHPLTHLLRKLPKCNAFTHHPRAGSSCANNGQQQRPRCSSRLLPLAKTVKLNNKTAKLIVLTSLMMKKSEEYGKPVCRCLIFCCAALTLQPSLALGARRQKHGAWSWMTVQRCCVCSSSPWSAASAGVSCVHACVVIAEQISVRI